MSKKQAPGTVIPYTELQGGMFSLFRPMVRAANGLTLGQICSVTGLEESTVQNWVKRGFVPHPIRKKYHERHLARILLISALRDSMKIDQIGELMTLVNGDTDDQTDDIVSEEQLYDYLCEIIRQIDLSAPSADTTALLIGQVIADYKGPDETAKARLSSALLVMVYAYLSGELRRKADASLAQLKQGA